MFESFKRVNKYLYFLLGISIVFSIGIVYITKVSENEEKNIRQEMLVLTETFANVLDAKKFENLKLNLLDTENPDYKEIKNKLVEFEKINKIFGINSIYTMVPRDGQIILAVDSTSNDSTSYLGSFYMYNDISLDFTKSVDLAWTKRVSQITKPYKNQWGSFISTIVPIIDKDKNEVVSVLATNIDYQLFYKNKIDRTKRLPIAITIFSLITFSCIYFYIIYLKKDRERLLKSKIDIDSAQKSLKIEDLRTNVIISSMGEGLILIDREYKITLINPKALELFGYSENEILGKDIRNILKIIKNKKELDNKDWPIEKSFNLNQVITTSLEDDLSIITDRKKDSLAVTFSISPLFCDAECSLNKIGVVIVVRDANKDRELDRAKSGFISIASHQLRTPLTSIRWYSEMLLSGSYGELSTPQHDLVKEIYDGANRLYQTINLLLGISRVENGKIEKEKKPIDLTAITTEVIKELSPSMLEKKLVYFSFSAQTDPIIVMLDPMLLRQVILNLFANSIRYTNNNGTIEGRWLIDKEKNEVIYSVRDNGIGIPADAQSRIFTKFFRADNAIFKTPDGSGLGLAFVKDIVCSWGGKVYFETEEGKGTTFFFTIPMVKA